MDEVYVVQLILWTLVWCTICINVTVYKQHIWYRYGYMYCMIIYDMYSCVCVIHTMCRYAWRYWVISWSQNWSKVRIKAAQRWKLRISISGLHQCCMQVIMIMIYEDYMWSIIDGYKLFWWLCLAKLIWYFVHIGLENVQINLLCARKLQEASVWKQQKGLEECKGRTWISSNTINGRKYKP